MTQWRRVYSKVPLRHTDYLTDYGRMSLCSPSILGPLSNSRKRKEDALDANGQLPNCSVRSNSSSTLALGPHGICEWEHRRLQQHTIPKPHASAALTWVSSALASQCWLSLAFPGFSWLFRAFPGFGVVERWASAILRYPQSAQDGWLPCNPCLHHGTSFYHHQSYHFPSSFDMRQFRSQ